MIIAKPLHIRFHNIDWFIRVYDGSRYLVLFGPEKYDAYLVSQKSSITYAFSHNYEKIKTDSYDYFSLEKTLTLHML